MGTGSVSVSVPLSTILRASEPSVSSSNVTMGNAVTIYTNRKSTSFAHTITYSFGSASGTIATGVGDNVSWTPPTSLASQILNSTTGTCTITCYTYSGSTLIGTKTVTLTLTVPSASNPSLSAGSITIGNAVTIYTNRKSTSFTHTVRYVWGSKSGTIKTSVTDNTQWTLPMDLCNEIPAATSGIGTIYIDTYNGSKLVGTTSIGFTGIVPDSVAPSISSVSVSAGNSVVPSSWGVYVQGKSSLKVVTAASGSYSSSIKSYKITGIDNNTYNSNDFTSAILQIVGTRTITITVTDSRGRTATTTRTYTCVAYSNPKITLATVTRCNADGVVNNQGQYVKYSFKASISPVNNKNSYVYKLGYKLHKDSTYTYITITNNSYTLEKIDQVLTDLIFSTNNSYDFIFYVADYFALTVDEEPVSAGFKLANMNASGKGFAIGKMSEMDAFEVGIPMYYNGQLMLEYEVVDEW